MAYRIGIAQGYAVRHGAIACDEAVRNGGLTMIAVARVATGVGAGGMGLEAAHAVTASPARRGMKAPTTKTASGMKAAATMKTASGTKATAVETATSATVETAATAAMGAAAPATARAGYVCERQSHDCAREDPSERQPNPFAVHSSQHIFLHLN
jgi:hypothetical protein